MLTTKSQRHEEADNREDQETKASNHFRFDISATCSLAVFFVPSCLRGYSLLWSLRKTLRSYKRDSLFELRMRTDFFRILFCATKLIYSDLRQPKSSTTNIRNRQHETQRILNHPHRRGIGEL
jgi:hypothetical protein